ncbi:hypothetical protein ACNRWW_17750 [Metabacillus sp. HB246100]
MSLKLFVDSLKKKNYILTEIIQTSLFVELQYHHEQSEYIHVTRKYVKKLDGTPNKVDIKIVGDKKDIYDVLENKVTLKQLLTLNQIVIKGSYRHFLKIDSLIRLC